MTAKEITEPQTVCETQPSVPEKTLHIAPMLDVSNREFRQFLRILSKKSVLWTEMVVDETIVHTTNLKDHLGFDLNTHPLICQIGGNSPELSGKGAELVEEYGYSEINLNCGCPSNRVSGKREFGAVLMKKVDTVVAMVESMKKHTRTIPISVKTRIGVDDHDNFEFLVDFVGKVSAVCNKFIIHARKCILDGLSPAQNRIVPPLNYPRVYELCKRFPNCELWINGGIPGLKAARLISYGTRGFGAIGGNENEYEYETEQAFEANQHVVPCLLCNVPNGSCTAPPKIAPPNLRGCMLGRTAMDNPSIFWDVDRYFYGEESNPCQNRRQVLKRYCEYLERMYPRRCCDKDERITFKMEMLEAIQDRKFCDLCQDIYGCDNIDSGTNVGTNKIHQGPVSSSDVAPIRSDDNDEGSSQNRWKKHQRKCPGSKISSRVIDRALKPALGIFFNLRGSKTFRRACDELSRDLEIRNCGPGFILRTAMKAISSEILDQDFVKTENLPQVIAHVPPQNYNSCCAIR